MNIDVDLNRWLPCQSRCELAGAASFFLSIKNSSILINGPRMITGIFYIIILKQM